MKGYRIGVDVGSTHTDAVILDRSGNLVYATKTMTTPDVTTGIVKALEDVLKGSGIRADDVSAVMFGTTHVINAIVQRKGLNRVGVIRIGLPATEAVEPLQDWPQDLKKLVMGWSIMIEGGHEYTGEPISKLDESSLRNFLENFVRKRNSVDTVAITSVFSIVNPEHEIRVREIVAEYMPGIPIVVSHEIGSIGLLERENATILNAASISVINKAIESLREALDRLGMGHARMFFAQNDGTTATAEYIKKFPIFTVVAPISNSIRGAYVLTQISNAIVADTGGTTTNIGALVNGYPREALEIEIGGVRTNIRAPDIISIGLAGGSIVKVEKDRISIGPESVGYRLIYEGIAWGGEIITATDIALAKGVMNIEDPRCSRERVQSRLSKEFVEKVYAKMVEMLEEALDRIKTRPEPETLILVGGGSAMWPRKLKGFGDVIRPDMAQYANAIGAATALVGASAERTFSYEHTPRSNAIEEVSREAKARAVEAGADPATIEVVEVEEIAMPYLPGNAVKIRVKAVGKLRL